MKWNEMKWNEMKWNEMKNENEIKSIHVYFLCVIICLYRYCLKTCFHSGLHERPPIGEWATLYKYQKYINK